MRHPLRRALVAALSGGGLVTAGLACGEDNPTGVPWVPVPGALAIAPQDTLISQGASFQLRIAVYDTSGNPMSVRPSFISSDPSRVTVSPSGLVRSVGPAGTAVITATLGELRSRIASVAVDVPPLTTRVLLGGQPFGAAISPAGVAFVTQLGFNQLARADLPAQTFVPSARVGDFPTAVAVNSKGTVAYATNQFGESVAVVDVATNRWVDTIPVTGDPFEVIVAPGDSILYVTTDARKVFGIRLATKEVVVDLTVPHTANGFAVHDTLLYVSTRAGGTVVEFNLRTRTVVRSFAVGGTPQKIALSANGTELYIANEAGYVQFWDLVTGMQLGANVPLPGGGGPGGGGFGIARRSSNGLLYVSTVDPWNAGIHVVDPATRTVVRTVVLGGWGGRIVFNETGTYGFATNQRGWVDFLQ